MSFSAIAFIKAIILPPALNFIMVVTGLLLLKKYKLFSKTLIYFSSITLVLFCLSPVSDFLLRGLEQYPPIQLPIKVNNEQAIVVLSGGSSNAEEFGRGIEDSRTLQRNRYAAFLHKHANLPLLVTGGIFEPNEFSEAAVMANTLKDSFNTEVKWQEGKSKNTAENAIYSTDILKQNGIDSIFLVTHAWHMPRAVMMFEQQGLSVTPAPTIFVSRDYKLGLNYYVPSAGALFKTRTALHEYIGILWYKLRY